jgi:hypothetical protein
MMGMRRWRGERDSRKDSKRESVMAREGEMDRSQEPTPAPGPVAPARETQGLENTVGETHDDETRNTKTQARVPEK